MSGFTEPTLEDFLTEQAKVLPNGNEAARRKDTGTRQAINGAHSWVRRNLESHLNALIASGREFTSDDLRDRAEPIATSPNLVGAVIRVASSAGRITQVGWADSRRPEARGRAVRVWRGIPSAIEQRSAA